MNGSGGFRWPLILVGGATLVAAGLTIGYGLRPEAPAPAPDAHQVHGVPAGHQEHGSSMPSSAGAHGAADIIVTLTPEMVARAGIRTAHPEAGTATTSLRMPGVVQANAYKQVAVTSLVSGRVLQVRAELGQRVNAGDPLATIYSPELADAQTAFIIARADQIAHGQRQTRTQRLTAIGAASREELETLEAERAMHDSAVEKARARLILLGIPEERTQRLAGPQDVVTTIDVRAPLAGVITERAANAGLNIDPATPLFTVVDLSTVWVIADLFERDFAKVGEGSAAMVTSAAYPGVTLRGRVSYIDPQVQQETRTAKLRVEVPNAGGRLRLGMYVDVNVGDTTREGMFVPKTAVQIVGSRPLVYVARQEHPGQFIEREVEVGDAIGDRVPVLSGLDPGERVVTEGVFFLRAERERTRGASGP
jgi:cobalt-zinc-cadmium efflux system membrane fusion protein